MKTWKYDKALPKGFCRNGGKNKKKWNNLLLK